MAFKKMVQHPIIGSSFVTIEKTYLLALFFKLRIIAVAVDK